MDIPDEAWAAVRNGSYCSEAGAVELAAPHIARSAQVAILREKSARAEEEARLSDSRLIRQRWEFLAMWLSGEATTLEAGAGQAGEVR